MAVPFLKLPVDPNLATGDGLDYFLPTIARSQAPFSTFSTFYDSSFQ